MDPAAVARYADAIVRGAVVIEPGDLLAVHGEPAHRDLLVALAEAGYRAGARYVDALMADPRQKRVRALHADPGTLPDLPRWHDQRMQEILKQDGAVVTVTGPEEPGLLADVPADRAARERTRTLPGYLRYMRALTRGQARFCVVGWPTPAWARSVFPHAASDDEAVDLLFADLLYVARLGPGDPADGWQRHVATLNATAKRVEALGLRRLHLRGPGIDLQVALPEGARWIGGLLDGPRGPISPNVPTEEVFTSPAPAGTSGTFRCSKPLEIEGRRIEGIEGEFRRGRLVRIGADREADRDFLAAYFDRDRGAGRLGEVALVPPNGRVGSTGRVYANTLLDENAASHIALGQGLGFTRRPGAQSVNRSVIHTDVMIGSPDMEVWGTDGAGGRVPVLVDGEFV